MMSPRNVRLSGAHWVEWIKRNAPTSAEIKDLDPTFRNKVTAFKDCIGGRGREGPRLAYLSLRPGGLSLALGVENSEPEERAEGRHALLSPRTARSGH